MNRIEVLKELIKLKSKCEDKEVSINEVTKSLFMDLGCMSFKEARLLLIITHESDESLSEDCGEFVDLMLKRLRKWEEGQTPTPVRNKFDTSKVYIFDPLLYKKFVGTSLSVIGEVERKINAIGDNKTVKTMHDGQFGICGYEQVLPAYCREEDAQC